MDDTVHCPRGLTERQAPSYGRYDYLDNLKWVLAILVILHHAAAIAGLDPFPINLPPVEAQQKYQYQILISFQSLNQGFFMSLFFFISAYFVVPSHRKKGSRLFLLDKLKRLGIPLLLTMALIDPLALYICGSDPLSHSFRSTFQMYGKMLESFNMLTGVTWFCWALIVFNVVYLIAAPAASAARDSRSLPRPLPSFLKILLFAAAMVPVDFLALHFMNRLGNDFLGFHLLKYFPMYIAMFYFGIQAWKHGWIEQLTWRHAFIWIVVWILAKTFLNPLGEMVSRPFTVVGMSIFLLHGFRCLFNTANQWTRLLARYAYAAYVVQVVPLCLIGKTYLPYMSEFPLLNFAAIGFLGILASFLLAHFVCKAPLLNRVF